MSFEYFKGEGTGVAAYRRGRYGDYGDGGWPAYVPVAERRRQAQAKMAKLKKQGKTVSPILIRGRTIASTFWGKAWCDNLEAYSDYSNRLPRGRTYVRNGSVIDLQIQEGKIEALVQGSSLYQVKIEIECVEVARWKTIVQECSGKVSSLIELLQGKFDTGVMALVTCPKRGLFPSPRQIKLKCSCPDWAEMCKHVAAVLYGVGARLDENPELLFVLRQVNHLDLIAGASVNEVLKSSTRGASAKTLEESQLSSLFGIELDVASMVPAETESEPVPRGKRAARKTKTPAKAKAKKRGAGKRQVRSRLR